MSFLPQRCLNQWMAAAVEPRVAAEPRLLALAQAGDERAFRELVEPHRRALEVHAYPLARAPHAAPARRGGAGAAPRAPGPVARSIPRRAVGGLRRAGPRPGRALRDGRGR